ncbi:helicase-related protein [Streptococcus mutans]|uniref:helicase-related protein n=1 Tax=Streptococcus mutans TaxID=1309 RepID=UPI00298887E9|nr:helicase-related protein [Streptococcus mutans]MDW5564558.1 helicase-related protein [Streptococcus mutans]
MALDNYIPEIGTENRIDNKLRTMRGAIGGLMEHSNKIRIASGYFRLSGIVELEEDFRRFFARSKENKIELLISNQYDTKSTDTRVVLGIAEGLADYSTESFYLDNQFYQELVEWIKVGRIEVKIFVDEKFYETHSKADIAFLHGKAYIFSAADEFISNSVLIGSSNFTYGGLVANRELNMITSDSFPTIRAWFDEMWVKYSEPYADKLLSDLEFQKEHYSKPKIVYTPIEYFYWNLGKYFGKKASETLVTRVKEIEKKLPYPNHKDDKKYFTHQFYGILHVYQALKDFDTQILADGVGLGKTLEAASIIKLYLQDLLLKNDKRRVLILANDRLREQWVNELENVGVISSQIDITTRQKFTGLSKEEIHLYAETYALVVIDEAHEGFLRKNNKAYQNMQAMVTYARNTQSRTIRGLLLTATPWNNSREDVIRLGLLFLNIQKIPKQRQYYNYVLSNREKLLYDVKDSGNYNHNAYVEFWKDLFYQRTRTSLANDQYLSDRYPKREFPLEDSEEPFTITYSSDVSQALREILERLIELKLPYQDTVWQYFGSDKESNVILRQRFQLLRRADSSNAAFGKSLENIKTKLKAFQKDILSLQSESLSQVKKHFYSKVNGDYAEDFINFEEGFDFSSDFDDYEADLNKSQRDRIRLIDEKLTEQTLTPLLAEMLEDAISDIQSLDEILEQWKITSKKDEKQKIILNRIKEIISSGGKVLIFSEFSDTVENYFQEMILDKTILEAGVGMIYGGSNRINHDESTKKEVLGRFSPNSKSYELFDKKEISVLIGTDAISTGQNLQDADHIITIELPYNPMRLEQRIGRIDRPKTKGENKIFVYAFPSEEIISAELKLSERFEGKAKGATTDTQGDFKLPFFHNGSYKGVVESLSDNNNNSEKNIQNELLASVSEFEARERVCDFYEKIGDSFVKNREFQFFPYSFNHKKSLLLFQTELNDINDNFIQKTAPTIWNISSGEQVDFLEAESDIREILQKNTSPEMTKADNLVDICITEQINIVNEIVGEYNKNLKTISELEQQPTYILGLRKILLDNMQGYKNNFIKQSVSGKEFNNIVQSLNQKGFNSEQQVFLRNLRDTEGNLSTLKIHENIWSNLKRFVEVFGNDSIYEEKFAFEQSKNKANPQHSHLNIISGVLKAD